ncbi:MAG: hypothetical protein IJ685_01080 [Selenomonadaceae bacterium]|nr:hypothetical protein [Selenomonadaceae bacterium]
MSDKMLKKILVVISENFSNGVRADFITDNQIRRAYKLRYSDEEIPASFSVMNFIKKVSFYYSGKYYFVTALNRGRIFRLVDKVLNAGNMIVYYDEFFSRYRGKLNDWHVKTSSVLGALLRTNDSQYYFSDKYFAVNKFVRLGDVIEYKIRALPLGVPFTVEQIHEQLSFVPSSEIERALSNPRKYSKTIDGKYLLTEQLSFDLSEINEVRRGLLSDLKNDGHAIFNVQEFPNTFALNPEFSEATIRGVVFDRFLSKDFSRHGNILTVHGAACGGSNLLKRFCSLREEMTLNELNDRARKLGILRQTTVIEVAMDSMIRVSKNIFVKDSFIKFHTSAIDEALTPFVKGRIIALRDVTSFDKFDPVKDTRGFEWEWNIYLLESFLRKVSRKYKFHTLKATSLVTGAICPRDKIFLNYIDLMSAVVMQENIPLDTNSIDAFLIEKNFRTRRVESLSTSIIERAHVMSLAI